MMRLLLAVIHLPGLVAGWLWVLLFYPWAAHKLRIGTLDDEPLMLMASWRPWAARIWKYTTTIGRGMVGQPGELSVRLIRHEAVHVRQSVDRSALALVVGAVVWAATGDLVLGLALWATGWAWQLPNFVTAAARWGVSRAYRDSEHEKSAYAQSDPWPGGGSWAERKP
jgi:hypothetical protein